MMAALWDDFGPKPWAVGLKASHRPMVRQKRGYALVEAWCNLMSQGGYKEKNHDEQSIPPGFQI